MNYFCCDERRRNAIRGTALNGIDFLEVPKLGPLVLQPLKIRHNNPTRIADNIWYDGNVPFF